MTTLRLIHGDALEELRKLEAGSVQACITDPPYNIGSPARVADMRNGGRLMGGDFGVFDTGAVTPADWLPLVLPLLKPGGLLISFYDGRRAQELLAPALGCGFEVVQHWAWCKPNFIPPMRSTAWAWALECGWTFRRAGDKHHHNNAAGISPNWFLAPICAGIERGEHPTQKPYTVMEWLVSHWTFPGDLVLDPFAGSGTTLQVARALGRHAIGIELNAEYIALAERRCALPWERTTRGDEPQQTLFGDNP